jgi:Ca-activated chloride channel family protein
MTALSFDPLVPWPVFAAAVVLAIFAGWSWRRRNARSRGGVVCWSAMGALLLLVALDPTVGGGRAAVKRADANVLFVVDTTGSMAAEDYGEAQPRLVGVRDDIVALADEFPGATFALVTFNSKTRVIVPWTTDRGALASAAQLLRQEWTQYAQGTRLDEPLATMQQLLPRAAGGGGYDLVFFLSDGEQTEDPPPRSFTGLDDDVDGGAVLGYGTSDGAPMRVYIGREEVPDLFIHDYETGEEAVSRIDEENLTTLADELGVAFVHRVAPGDVEDIADRAADGVGSVYAGERDTERRLYWLPAFGVVALVLWQLARTAVEIVDDRRALGRTRGATS